MSPPFASKGNADGVGRHELARPQRRAIGIVLVNKAALIKHTDASRGYMVPTR
jgi:hypothetical protein